MCNAHERSSFTYSSFITPTGNYIQRVFKKSPLFIFWITLINPPSLIIFGVQHPEET